MRVCLPHCTLINVAQPSPADASTSSQKRSEVRRGRNGSIENKNTLVPRSEHPLRLEFGRDTYQTWREREPQVPSSWGLPGRERMKWARRGWQSMLQVKMLKRGNVQGERQ